MISLNSTVDDAARSVVLTALTDKETVDFYRRVGLTEEQSIATKVPVVNGVAVFVDSSPPEKVLLTYYAVDSSYERTQGTDAVVPSTWQLTRPALAGDIRLGDMIFNTIDSLGTVWTVSDIDGWWTLPDAQVPSQVRSREEDGSYDDSGRYLARELMFSGVFLPRTPDLVEASRARLIKQLDAVRNTVSLRVDETPPRRLDVRLAGKSSIQTIRQSGLSEFAIQLRAPDPVKYGLTPMRQLDGSEAVRIGPGAPSGTRAYPRDYDADTDNLREYGPPGSPNEITIVNEGTYTSPPIIRVDGPVVNPLIELSNWSGKTKEEPTETMGFTIMLQEGQFLEIDVREKTVLLNGSSSRRGTMTFNSDWFYLRPGANTIRYTAFSAASGTTSMAITAYSAWLG